jgi:predicted small secreted protein
MKKLLVMWAAVFAVLLTGCNTMEGFGKDMEAAGDAIEDKAAGEDVDEGDRY